jgi:hypothetical protein
MKPSEPTITRGELSMFRWVRGLSGLLDTDARRQDTLTREWDRMRAAAVTPSERAEIDAIFARHVA